MLLADQPNIRDVILFPTLRPEVPGDDEADRALIVASHSGAAVGAARSNERSNRGDERSGRGLRHFPPRGAPAALRWNAPSSGPRGTRHGTDGVSRMHMPPRAPGRRPRSRRRAGPPEVGVVDDRVVSVSRRA